MNIYEVRDTTNEEVYNTLAYYDSLEKAVDSVTSDPEPPIDNANDEEHASIEIHRHELNTWRGQGAGVKVWRCDWSSKYNEETDEYAWTAVIEEKKP